MPRVCAVSLFLALLLPASASAAPFGELAPLSLPGEDECVLATGMPGELTTATKTGVRFVRATRDGLALAGTVEFGHGFECGTVQARPGGAGVVAGLDGDRDVVAALREPGGTWGAGTLVARTSDWIPDTATAAVSDRGDALVLWRETRYENGGEPHYRYRAARRAPGGGFGPEEPIGPEVTRPGLAIGGIAATGEAFVLWTEVQGTRAPFHVPVNLSMAAPGAKFAAPVQLGATRWLSVPALAVAADGRALVAVPDGKSLLVSGREPGGAFGPPTALARAGDPARTVAAAQLGAHGEAAITWAGEFSGRRVATRRAPGAFSAPVALTPSRPHSAGLDPVYYAEAFWAGFPLPPFEFPVFEADAGAAALTADARALVAGDYDGAATLALGEGMPEPLRHGAAAGFVRSTTPFTLADGTPALTWVDNDTAATTQQRYRLHLAVEGVAGRVDGPVPRVRFGKPSGSRIPVTCSGPCELRAQLGAGSGHALLPHGGRGELQLGVALPAGVHRVPVRVTYAAPDATRGREQTIVMRLRGTLPRALHFSRVSAVRHGDAIRVTWHIDRAPSFLFPFLVAGTATRAWTVEPLAFASFTALHNERSMGVTLRRAKGVRWVTVQSFAVSFSDNPHVVVRVR